MMHTVVNVLPVHGVHAEWAEPNAAHRLVGRQRLKFLDDLYPSNQRKEEEIQHH